MTVFKHFHQRYLNENSVKATAQYKKIAGLTGLSLTTMALNWCKSRSFPTSTIIGATTLEQLKENIDAFEPTVKLSKETLKAIGARPRRGAEIRASLTWRRRGRRDAVLFH